MVTTSDLYKYHEGGMDFGAQANEEKRSRMIADAIAALMADDDE